MQGRLGKCALGISVLALDGRVRLLGRSVHAKGRKQEWRDCCVGLGRSLSLQEKKERGISLGSHAQTLTWLYSLHCEHSIDIC